MEDWLVPLQQNEPDVAWDRFLSRYRGLIFATIRHYTRDYDDGMDLFAHVCEKLQAEGMARLRGRAEEPDVRAKFSTWLVVVVRHLAIDWFRHRDGRQRLGTIAVGLPPLRRHIFELVFLQQCSHVEAFERLRSESPDLTFRGFLGELRETYRAVSGGKRGGLLRTLGTIPDPTSDSTDPTSPLEAAERSRHLQQVLSSLSPEDRLAVQLYLLEDLPADKVAAMLGLSGAKAVYNRVYRVLDDLRTRLGEAGIHRGDL